MFSLNSAVELESPIDSTSAILVLATQITSVGSHHNASRRCKRLSVGLLTIPITF